MERLKTIMMVTPHLSTGGLPQVLAKKIEILKDTYNVICVEWSCIAWSYVVQRNRIIDMLGSNFFSLGENKEYELFNLIEDHQPDIIFFEELVETFIPNHICDRLYEKEKTYKIIETTHSSYSNPSHKKYFPDKFIFVCSHSAINFSKLGIPFDVIEHPVDIKPKNQFKSQITLGLDPEWKHIINIGLFTENKNQGYVFEIAKKLEEYKIKFHFIGNQAVNFQYYWEPLMKEKPKNCEIWGERDDVETFIQSSDLFLFPTILELNPISIKESMEYQVPVMMYDLDVYYGKYTNNPLFHMLTGNVETDSKNVLKILGLTEKDKVQPNIKLVHLLLDLDYSADIPKEKWQSNISRQNKSIQDFTRISNKFSSYVQLFSKVNRSDLPKHSSMFPEIVKESLVGSVPPHLSYGHYGAWRAHKRGATQEFSDEVDALIIIESDVSFDVSDEVFYETIMEGYNLGKSMNAGFVTFAGSKWFPWFSDYNSLVEDIDDKWERVPHFALGSMYIVFKNIKNIIKEKYNTLGWHSPDVWLAEAFHNQTPMISLKEPMVYQVTGFSLIDYYIKDTHGNNLE